MKIIMLSWEFPPRIVGGIAPHVHDISIALAAAGTEVHVITAEFGEAPAYEQMRPGLHVHRVHNPEHSNDFIHWVQQLNVFMLEKAQQLIEGRRPASGAWRDADGIIIHAHDWLSHFAAAHLKHQYHLPMVSTIHATEFGRNGKISTDIQKYISSVEWQLAFESWRVICCSDFMRNEIASALECPWDKMDVIPNGVNVANFTVNADAEQRAQFRSRFAADYERIVFFIGRMVREKGGDLLIDALAQVRTMYKDVRLVIGGGGKRDNLQDFARWLGVSEAVTFTGYLSDDDKRMMLACCDVACFPSRYEPFGIVALEAMAAQAPVIVSDTGGLKEIIRHNVDGLTFFSGDSTSLARMILKAIAEPDYNRSRAQTALQRVKELYNWPRISGITRAVYDRVWEEYRNSSW